MLKNINKQVVVLLALQWESSKHAAGKVDSVSLSGSRGKPCPVAEGMCEGAGGVVPEHSHCIAVRGGETLPAECLEQACREQYSL